MSKQLSRRKFIGSAAATSATIIGLDLRAQSWITPAQGQAQSFQGVPTLDGALLFDETSRKAIAVDKSNLFHRVPAAVLKPASIQDIVKMVQYANQHSLKVAIKGDGHSQYGQSQAEGGIVVDSRTLSAVHAPTTESVDVEPGAFWGDVATATLAKGLTPRVYLATCMAVTVGGTLSVGGIGNTSHHYGAQVDNVTELDVVTGDGRLVTCSPDRESELFNMVLGGLGQCGIIVRAKVSLVPAPSHVTLHDLIYADLDKYLTDQLQLAKDGRFDSQRGGMSRKKNGEWSFDIEVGKFFSPPDEPDFASLESGLQFDFATAPRRMTYRDYLFRFEAGNAAALSNKAPRVFITMWLPASAAKDYLSNIFALPPDVAGLPRVAELERFGFGPLNTRRFTRPMFKVPDEDWAFSVWLFRSPPVGDQAALSAMMASNRELLAKMTAVGGKRYSPYSGVMSSEEWAAHFGPALWRRLSEAKKKFDPNNVLTPGVGIFA
jgi:FAD/FMN-containing dehydrogenase